jgi:hypothetical protein
MTSLLLANIEIDRIFLARPVSGISLTAGIVVALLLAIVMYKKKFDLPPGVRAWLFVSRFAIYSALLVMLFEPTARIKETRQVKRQLPVLVDVSESMSIQDQRKRPADVGEAAAALGLIPEGETNLAHIARSLNTRQRETLASASRLDLAKGLLSGPAGKTFTDLSEDFDLSYHAFGGDVRLISATQANAHEALASLQAVEQDTSISKALNAVANANRAAPLAGIVLISDGLDHDVQKIDEAVNELGRKGIPVFSVPVGITDPDDVSIRNIIMQNVAFPGDKVPVRLQLRSKGYEKRPVDIRVMVDGQLAAERTITLRGGLQYEDVFFNVTTSRKASADITISISAFSDEAAVTNNEAKRSIRIVNEKINVLCMEGSPRWEYRYLRAMLKRDPRINATFIASRAEAGFAQTSTEYIARFPATKEEAFKYDLVILGDVDAGFFSPDEMMLLEQLVRERGGSLLMICGPQFSPASYSGTLVESMLPVSFVPDGQWTDVSDTTFPILTPEGESSLVLTLEDDAEENLRVWSRVAPLVRVPPLLTAKPGASILAELSDSSAHNGRFPLVSWQRYGAGKCMAIGTDRLWLLRFKTGDKYHWRVWSQCIQFLTLSRLMGEHKRYRLETDRASYGSGEQVQVYAHLVDDTFAPVQQPGFEVNVSFLGMEGSAPKSIMLRPVSSSPGLYEGFFSPHSTGQYRVSATTRDENISNATEFQVADVNTELAETNMQLQRLKRLSDISGGEVLSANTISSLNELLDRSPHETVVTVDRPLWNNGWAAFILILLTGLEWITRRRYDLS